jgi:hypothetical protein
MPASRFEDGVGIDSLKKLLISAAIGLLAATCAQAADGRELIVPRTDEVPGLEELTGMVFPERLRDKFGKVDNFVQRIPVDGGTPAYPNEVYVAYDDKNLYAIFFAFDDEPEKLRANMAPRGEVFRDDTVNIMIDTFNDQRRAYFFMSNALGIQSDGQFIEGNSRGNGGFDGSFEAVWDSEGTVTDRGFVVKMTIPFKSIRFPATDQQEWRVIFNRMNQRLSEDNFWPTYTLAIEGRLNQTAPMRGIEGVSPGRNMQLVPFVFLRDFRVEEDSVDGLSIDDDDEIAVGLDAKMVVKDALVLDLTANPDFSQVEADEPQVTVNERFEVFFPERRPFFLENSDLFNTPSNLMFSRRIVDPSAGAKLTGKQGPWAIGVLLANDDAPGKSASPGETLFNESAAIGVVRLARDVADQSKIGIFVSDRELAGGHNRVGAIDGRFKLNDNWVLTGQFAAADTRQVNETDDGYDELNGVSWNAYLDRSGTHLSSHTHYLYTSEGFRTDLGFFGERQRIGVQDLHNNVNYTFRPADSKLTEGGPSVTWRRIWETGGDALEWALESEMRWEWVGRTNFRIGQEHRKVQLGPEEFEDLPAARDYTENEWTIRAGSARWTRFSVNVGADFGTRINFVPPEGEGPRLADFVRTQGSVTWRPLSPLKLDFSLIRNELDARDGSGRIFTNSIGRARANWQFTKELSLRLIADVEDLDTAAGQSTLEHREQLTTDLLIKYLWNPWKALYVGYTSNRRDFQEFDDDSMTLMDLRDEGRQVFVKFSYLFQL